MTEKYMSETLRELVDGKYLVFGIIAAIIIEFIMIVQESYLDFPTPMSSIQLYCIIIIVTAIIYHYVWSVPFTRILNIIIRTFLFILPIGLIWAYYDGYTNESLMNWEWLFTHDMVYVVAVSQVVILLIFMVGLRDYKVIKGKQASKKDIDEEDIGVFYSGQ